ncbi:Cuticle protein 6 [Armadillidium nasatum]|uniref:Cuticle protein 6 n=1 Tax=Armadillidium nasatum TaxID=96803 RepID=A0A5N5ST85_9CRUS|nr:Cuticle protein 6 [Armadillidium nasatum]
MQTLAAPAERGAFHVGGKGVYNYGYNTGDGIAKVEVRHPDGTVTGSYRYFDPLGRQIVRSYIADKRGFRVLGNELPVAPDTPAIGFPEAQSITGAVEGTREFASPNVVTQDETELLLQNNEALQSSFNEQNNNYILKQQQQLQEQKENLEKLKLQNEVLIKQQQEQIKKLQEIQERSLRPNQKYSTYYSTLGNSLDSPYFFSSDNIRYDFPAGFAYHAIPQRIFLKPIGVTGTHGKVALTAGHTSARNSKLPEASPSSDILSYYRNKVYRRPYIIGHAK